MDGRRGLGWAIIGVVWLAAGAVALGVMMGSCHPSGAAVCPGEAERGLQALWPLLIALGLSAFIWFGVRSGREP